MPPYPVLRTHRPSNAQPRPVIDTNGRAQAILVALETSQASGWLKASADCQTMRCAVGTGRARWILRGGCGVRRAVQRAGGAAHGKHPVHAGHARDVPIKWLVESSCILPNKPMRGRKWQARLVLRGGGGAGQVVQRQAALRTENIQAMLVTLETSQASSWLKASAACRARRGKVGSGRRGGSHVAGGVGLAPRTSHACWSRSRHPKQAAG